MIHSCPHCGTDLTDDATTFWCPAEQRPVTYAEVISQGERP